MLLGRRNRATRDGAGPWKGSGLGSDAIPETSVKALSVSSQASAMAGKVPEVGVLGTAEKKVKMLEQQRMEVGGWTGWSVSIPPLLGPEG